jgi:hypothetical protein
MRRHRAPLAALLALAGGTVMAGCSASVSIGEKTVNPGSAERSIRSGLAGQIPPPGRLSLDCPSGVKAKAGKRFSCKAKINGEPETVLVRVSAVNGNDAKFGFKLAYLLPGHLRDVVTNYLQGKRIPVAAVSCPARQSTNAGTQFLCQVTATDGTQGAVQVLVRDNQGTLVFRTQTNLEALAS